MVLVSCQNQIDVTASGEVSANAKKSAINTTVQFTATAASTPTSTQSPSITPSQTNTIVPSNTPTPSRTPTATSTPTETPTFTPTPKPTSTPAQEGNPVFTVAVIVDRLSERVTREQAQEVIDRASNISEGITGIPIKMVDFVEDWRDPLIRNLLEDYIEENPNTLPNGIVVFTFAEHAKMYGAYADTYPGPPGFKNPFNSPIVGDDEIYLAIIHFSARYGACGYGRDQPDEPISATSLDGECRDRSGIRCVEHLGYSFCPHVVNDLYASERYYMTSATVLHEFMHWFGFERNYDHFGSPACNQRMSRGQSSRTYSFYTNYDDLAARNEVLSYVGMCPYVFDVFVNSYQP